MEPDAHPPVAEEQLPFDPRTLLLCLWGRRRWFAAAAGAALVVGLTVGLLFGARTYRAETILLFKTSLHDPADPGVLHTMARLVKLSSNLGAAREEVGLPASLDQVGAAISAEVQDETDLLLIRATWHNGQQAADLANAVRRAFLASSLRIRGAEASARIADLERRLATILADLSVADGALEAFTRQHQIIDLDKEAQQYLEELVAIELFIAETEVERIGYQTRRASLDIVFDQLKVRAREEVEEQGAIDNLGEMNLRSRRLRDAIHDDQSQRNASAILTQRQAELDKARALSSEGLISRLELERAESVYSAQQAVAVDTVEIEQWRQEIDLLDEAMIPGRGRSPMSGNLTSSVLLRSFDIELEDLALDEQVEYLKRWRLVVLAKLQRMPAKQKRYVTLRRDVVVLEAARETVEGELSQALMARSSEASEFHVVSAATASVYPISSSRKPIAAAVAGAVAFSGFALILGLQIFDNRVSSAPDLARKTGLAVLASVPSLPRSSRVLPDWRPSLLAEPFRGLLARLPAAGQAPGSILLVVSAVAKEGRTLVTRNLADSMARTGKRVLIIDTDLRRGRSRAGDADLPEGLTEYLSSPQEAHDRYVQSTDNPGVFRLPAGRGIVPPELLASARMARLLDSARQAFDLVILDGPQLGAHADAELLGRQCDGVIFVVRSQSTSVATVRYCVSRLQRAGAAVLGTVLNCVEPAFLNLSESA